MKTIGSTISGMKNVVRSWETEKALGEHWDCLTQYLK